MSPPPRQPSLNILKQSLVDVPRPYRSLNARTAAGGCPSTLRTNAFLPRAENSPTSCRDCGRTSLLLNESYGGIRGGLDQNLLTAVPWDNQAHTREQGTQIEGPLNPSCALLLRSTFICITTVARCALQEKGLGHVHTGLTEAKDVGFPLRGYVCNPARVDVVAAPAAGA